MKKAADLRDHLTRWVPDLAANPDKLHVFIEKGRIVTKAGASRSFEYRYTLQLVVTDFAESTDVLIVPIIVWLQTNQPDLLLDPNRQEQAIRLEAEMIDHDKVDIALTIELSERVLVKPAVDGYTCEHLGEPQLPDLGGPLGWEIYLKGELISTGVY